MSFPECYQIGGCIGPGSIQRKASLFYAGGLEANQNAGGSQLMILKELYKYQLAWLQRTPCMCLGGKRLLMCNVNKAIRNLVKEPLAVCTALSEALVS